MLRFFLIIFPYLHDYFFFHSHVNVMIPTSGNLSFFHLLFAISCDKQRPIKSLHSSLLIIRSSISPNDENWGANIHATTDTGRRDREKKCYDMTSSLFQGRGRGRSLTIEY